MVGVVMAWNPLSRLPADEFRLPNFPRRICINPENTKCSD